MSTVGSNAGRFRLVDDEAMLREPEQEYLIDGVCSASSLVLMHGQSGAGKSFLALDAAFAIATGTDWHGHAVKNAGAVVYVAAEGQGGLKYRIEAWKAYHGRTGSGVLGVHFILEAVDPLNGADVDALCEQLHAQFAGAPPRLVVVDTYAECLAAGVGDENSTRDTGQAVAGWKRIVSGLGATVWIIHHQGVNDSTRARGNSAFKAATDTEIAVEQNKNGIVTVKNPKQRNFAEFDSIALRLHVVDVGGDRDSCVLVPSGAKAAAPTRLTERAAKALAALYGATESGLTHSDWRESSQLTESTFDRAIDDLLTAKYVAKPDDGRGALYVLTDAGRDYRHRHIASTDTSTESNGAGHDRHHQPSPPRRGDGGGGDGNGNGMAPEPDAPTSLGLDFSDASAEPMMPFGKYQGRPITSLPTGELRRLLSKRGKHRLWQPDLRDEAEEELARRPPGKARA